MSSAARRRANPKTPAKGTSPRNRQPAKARKSPAGTAPDGRTPAADTPDRASSVSDGSVYDQVYEVAGPIADLPTAYDAEMVVSALLGGAYAAADTERATATVIFAEGLATYAASRDTARSRAVLAGLAAVAPPPAADQARAAEVAFSGAPADAPPWLTHTGDVRCIGTWAVRDRYGDQTEYIATFAYADELKGGPEHAVCVLLDHNLNRVKDLFVVAPAELVTRSWEQAAADDPEITLTEADPAVLRAQTENFLAATDALDERPTSETFAEERAIAMARLATLPPDGEAPVVAPLDDRERAELIAEFATAPEADFVDADVPPERGLVIACARAAIDYACDVNSGDPLRWSPAAVELFLCVWAPGNAALPRDAEPWLPEVLGAFVAYAGRRRNTPPDAIAATRNAVANFGAEYIDAKTGTIGGERATELLAKLLADGVDPSDETAVRAWLTTYQRLP